MNDGLPLRAGTAGRIVFDTFRSVHDPMLSSWLRFRSQVAPALGAALPGPPGDERAPAGRFGVWRILASNNRELGRGAALHATPTDARRHVEALRAAVEALTPTVVRGPQSMAHGWILRQGPVPALIGSRWYESAAEAAAAARMARTVLGTAAIAAGVSIGTQSGRRHRRDDAVVEPSA